VVGHDEEAMPLEVVGRVDDHGQPTTDRCLQPVGEFRPTDAAREGDDACR
jgi:hypothetical protein